MSDSPNLQNAAQIAARKIKAKPTVSRAKRALTPQSPSFAPSQLSSTNQPGSLFGGSVQAPSTFSFSAPTNPGFSFGGSFGSATNPFSSVNSNDSDGRSDTSAEENARTKRQQSSRFGMGTADVPAQSLGLFGNANAAQNGSFGSADGANKPVETGFSFGQASSGQTANNGFGANSMAGNGFNLFGSRPTTADSAASVNITNNFQPAQDALASQPLLSQQAPASTIANNIFSSNNSTTSTRPSSPFSFHNPSSTADEQGATTTSTSAAFTQTPTFSFGKSVSGDANSTVTAPNAAQDATAQPSSTITGAVSTTDNMFFGQHKVEQPPAMGFQAQQQGEQRAPSIFDDLPKQPAVTSFGSSASQSSNSGFGTLFGSQNTGFASSSSSNLFAQARPDSMDVSSNMFGQSTSMPATNNTGASQGGFSSNSFAMQASQKSPSGNSVFGGANNAENSLATPGASSTSLFGAKPSATPAANPSFGNAFSTSQTQSQTTQSSGLFGQAAKQSTSNMFGNVDKPVEQPSSLFGSMSNPAQSQSNPFGGGSKPAGQTNMFGSIGKSASDSIGAGAGAGTGDANTTIAPKDQGTASSNAGRRMLDRVSAPAEPATSNGPRSLFDRISSSTSAPIASTATQPFAQPAAQDQLAKQGNIFSQVKSTAPQPLMPQSTAPKTLIQSIVNFPKPSALVEANPDRSATFSASELSEEEIAKVVEVPPHFTSLQKHELFVAYRMRSLNITMARYFMSLQFGTEVDLAIAYYKEEQAKILAQAPSSLTSKRKAADPDTHALHNENKRLRFSREPATPTPSPASSKPFTSFGTTASPSKPSTSFGTTATPSNPFKGLSASSTAAASPMPSTSFGQGVMATAAKGKRKADGDHPEDPNAMVKSKRKADGDHPDDPNVIARQNLTTPSNASSTSKLMQSIVGSSAEKNTTPNGHSTAGLNLFGKPAAQTPATPSIGSDGEGAADTTEKENEKPKTAPFTQPINKTWNPESPIKFGSQSATKPTSGTGSSSLFGNIGQSSQGASQAPSSLFGPSTQNAASTQSQASHASAVGAQSDEPAPIAANPFKSLVPTSTAPSSSFSFGPSTKAPTPSLFSGLGSAGQLAPTASQPMSFASSNNSTNGSGQSLNAPVTQAAAGDDDEEVVPDEQIDLKSSRVGEESEACLFEARTKVMIFDASAVGKFDKAGAPSNGWIVKGLGNARVLQNPNTKVLRVLVRSDPSGNIVFNENIQPAQKYEASGKTVKVVVITAGGNATQTWVFQVKTKELANEFAQCLENNKH